MAIQIELLTDQAEIEKYILADRKRVAEIYIQAAQENLDKGWYSGDAIDKALFFSASHPTYKPINIELRHRRLKNIIHACCHYQHKTTEHFIHLCRATIDMYKNEQQLSDLELSQLNLSEENSQQKANEYLSQLKGLLKS